MPALLSLHRPALAWCVVLVAGATWAFAVAAQPLSFTPMDLPAREAAGLPSLAASADGSVLLSWVEPDEAGGHALRFSRLTGAGWSSPLTIARGDDWFVNWADFPSLVALPDGRLAAHLLVKSGDGPYAYDVHVTQSSDGGRTWTSPAVPHRDGTPTEHGFVSLFSTPEEGLTAVWLDGRHTGGHDGSGGAMTLRSAVLTPDGQPTSERELDRRVCDCCQTDAARTAYGALVAYRDRSDAEVRDIAVVRWAAGEWTEPRILHPDGWELHGCPVNGPAVAADGRLAAVAWFTAARDQPQVQVVFSSDEGVTFGTPVRVDDGAPLGRVDVVLLGDGSALISWVEKTSAGADLRLRRIRPDGTRDPFRIVARTSPARASGFPRMVRSRSRVVVAWTEAGEPSRLRAAVASWSED